MQENLMIVMCSSRWLISGIEEEQKIVTLKGISYRIEADAPEDRS